MQIALVTFLLSPSDPLYSWSEIKIDIKVANNTKKTAISSESIESPIIGKATDKAITKSATILLSMMSLKNACNIKFLKATEALTIDP